MKILRSVILGLVLVLGAASLFHPLATVQGVPRRPAGPIGDLQERMEALEVAVSMFQHIPVGTVVAFAGSADSVPEGWMLCDGAAVDRIAYEDLFSVIDTLHGHGDGATTFNLPDYRGRFLRGVDGAAGRDPNSGSRSAMSAGGNMGNAVGTVQDGATRRPNANFISSSTGNHGHTAAGAGMHAHFMSSAGRHDHDYFVAQGVGESAKIFSVLDASRWRLTGVGNARGATDEKASHTHTILAAGNHQHSISVAGSHGHTQGVGDDETRPINAYVNWIIKY